MKPLNYYKSVPDELQALAFAAEAWFKKSGFSVSRELADIEHPALATMTCRRSGEVLYVLVRSTLDLEELTTWVRYGRSCTKATSVAMCVPARARTTTAKIAKAQVLNGGLYSVLPDRTVQCILQPGDLSFNPSLPDISSLPKSARVALMPAYEMFRSGNWRRGFEDACKVAENSSRTYLLKIQKLGRAVVLDGSKQRNLTAKEIKRLPLGALADVFCKLKAQNATEAFLCTALKRINPERIITTHKGTTQREREKLKKAVGRHMWGIHNVLGKLAG